MKNIFFIFLITISFFKSVFADDEMWLPVILQQLNMSDYQSRGLKLTAEDIYSINNSSLKDAIVLFGGGCTAAVVSEEGLIITNHHCGYSQIQANSTVEKNYLKDGFWAANHNEELQAKGLTVTFLIRIENVTQQVLAGVTSDMNETQRGKKVDEAIKKIETEAIKNTHYIAKVKPFSYGNEYYLFVSEVFKDIRLVGAPPESIGKFGGEDDNWVWPRHNGDFCFFRIYANAENKPAEYSANNVPYKPKKSITISSKGIKKDDFTIVLGYPGRTSEYLTSYGIEMLSKYEDPSKTKIRELRLSIMDEYMKTSEKVYLRYASRYAGVANGWKKWLGENNGIKKYDVIGTKKQLEQRFIQWANENKNRKKTYGNLLNEFETTYKKLTPLNQAYNYYSEIITAIEIFKYVSGFSNLITKSYDKSISKEEINKITEQYKTDAKKFFANYNKSYDKKMFEALIKLYYEGPDKSVRPEVLEDINIKFNCNFKTYTEYVFENSFLTSEEKVLKFLNKYNHSKASKVLNDPLFSLSAKLNDNYYENILPSLQELNVKIDSLQRIYFRGLCEMQPEKKLYPDANLTMRVNFGKVDDYYPYDAVHYLYFTTLDGVMEKEDTSKKGFSVPEKLKILYKNKDYGKYGVNGIMPVCFIASNHTAGGNSGSPVLNGEGRLIGLNFDRSWEGTMSDVMYDSRICRNVVVDARYILFIIDKFAGANNLLNEMKITEN
ncbi:MAG: S46 family peptidase [Bacteroidales bacterium]|nr:S46 family peptidase [Bacteroidales bacterium]